MALILFLPCAAGVEELLAQEVAAILPGVPLHTSRGGVALEGGPPEVMRLNLECRLTQRVLIEVAEGPYAHEDDIYALGRSVDWTQWITPAHTLRVDTTATRSPLRSLNFVALRIKDAVCDVLREATGERPSVDTRHPDCPLLLHLGPERASVYVDSSGEPLFKRGWREDKGDAPLKETLAAAMLAASGELDPGRGGPNLGLELPGNIAGAGGNVNPATWGGRIPENVSNRRTIYFPMKRERPQGDLEILSTFDFPHPNEITGARPETTVATQALFLMNAPFVKARAQRLAERLAKEESGDERVRPMPARPDPPWRSSTPAPRTSAPAPRPARTRGRKHGRNSATRSLAPTTSSSVNKGTITIHQP